MKQELSTTDHKASSPAPAARARISRTRDNPRRDLANGVSPGLKTRPKVVPLEANTTQRVRRSIQLNKTKLGADEVEAPKERETEDSKITSRPGNRVVEQYARLRRQGDTHCRGSEDEAGGKTKELQRKLDEKERLVKELQSEMVGLRAQIEKLQGVNLQLESQNKKLGEDLLDAEGKIRALQRSEQVVSVGQEAKTSGFRDVQKLIASKLDQHRLKDVVKEDTSVRIQSLASESRTKVVENQPQVLKQEPFSPAPTLCTRTCGPPAPPPPPPPRIVPARQNTVQKATALVELYHSLTKRDGKKDPVGNGNSSSPVAGNAHNSIVGELQNRSAHLLAIKADVETKGDFIRQLIQKVQSAAYMNMEDVLVFVDWLDGQLATLADESAVLKHFNWPERKADALREAACEYRDLKQVEAEVSSFKDDTSMPCDATLKKISNLLDKLERSMHRLIKLRNTSMLPYKECKIPTDWMLDPGMVSKLKLASVKLAKVYLKRVSMELESVRHSERESAQEALVFQGVRFAYRVHQFAGGLDSETMCAFEELRERIQSKGRGSKDLLPITAMS
ncbi:INCREASED PETAL GROWTH ANISOTROPY 1-like protein 2 [Elaeis guineensis]|uniref:Protein CHUP1, chloroplastic n=1 Tax=Elaeis guineensis var. tenera TaxID=51953 RepID=A0A6I9QXF6_ELAGV|nr:protein CHUP1, chloroplastic [Elaeis guineensis]